jgi:hypothetical protein
MSQLKALLDLTPHYVSKLTTPIWRCFTLKSNRPCELKGDQHFTFQRIQDLYCVITYRNMGTSEAASVETVYQSVLVQRTHISDES